jgi:voltage-gated potassium channel
VEYFARLWACTINPAHRRPIVGRIRFALRPMPMVDLIAILPFFLPFLGFDLRFVRMFRLFRLVRIAKIGRYYSSLRLIRDVLIAKKEELILSTAMLLLLLVVSSCLMYECEHYAQPEAFPDIPSTMWWSVVTLTTVGYGDVYPQTGAGKFFAAVIAILGIGMFALPTGIVGAGFVEEIAQRKESDNGERTCPHCGEEL